MDVNIVIEIIINLIGFGEILLGYIVDLLPALATLAAIMFVIRIIRKKVRA